ncbi:MAG: FG-GAP-like repeat-containing protein [bacterium]
MPTRFVAWEDISGGGLLDLIASSFSLNKFGLAIYLAGSTGNFSTALHNTLQDHTSYFQLRDLDSDEDLDILATLPLLSQGRNDVSGRIGILKNDGKSTFSSRQMLVPQGMVPAFLDARDLDGDGDIDVACTNTGTLSRPDSTVTFFLNDGAGHFTTVANLKVGRAPKGLRLVDINQDSRLDLAVITVDPPALHLFLADSLTSGTDNKPIPNTHRLSLKINPNPFRDAVMIHLQAPANVAGELFVFDVLGRKVFSALIHLRHEKETILWNGRDLGNRLIPSGIYFAKLTVGAESASKKLVLLR